MNELWRSGYEACSVKAISEKLGITRSSFYNAFNSRAALFWEVVDRYNRQSPDRVIYQVDADTPILPMITNMFRAICHARASDPEARGCMVVNCLAELIGVNETLGPVLEDAVRGNIDRLEGLLRQAAAQGELEDGGDLRDKALALQNLMIGLNVMCKIVKSEADLWTVARQTLKGLGLYEDPDLQAA
ncbi:MAG: TetR/AcrR family transcriptional regulator [Alphaproteobacteria bacterium]